MTGLQDYESGVHNLRFTLIAGLGKIPRRPRLFYASRTAYERASETGPIKTWAIYTRAKLRHLTKHVLFLT